MVLQHLQHYLTVTVVLCVATVINAQEASACYGGGSIAASVIITVLVILILLGAGYYAWKRYRKYKKGQHLILETDPEKGSEYVFDNPGFKDAASTPAGKDLEKPKVDGSANKHKWSHWSTLTAKNEKRRTQDDSVLNEGEVKVVSLRSHDFTGLGFSICGNMRDGIYIKDILHHGPASECGKLNPGDRITSITINFENMVFDDALTILSYASPYEVIIEAKNGRLTSAQTNTSGQPNHPLYRSSSSTDLLQIGRSAKKRLFQAEELNDTIGSNCSSLQKSRSNATTLERSQDSPKKPSSNKKAPPKTVMNPDQLKSQLEQKILEDHNENLRNKHNYEKAASSKTDLEVQRSSDGNRYQKFGIKVLPMEQKDQKEQKSPKTAELSQNDNNINIEKNDSKETSGVVSVDEVDKKQGPPVKKREKKPAEESIISSPENVPDSETDQFVRRGSLNSSGIKRDANGIPQEIPNHMMNAAVAARRNRKPIEENTPKKQKGKAPAPPEGTKLEDSPSNLDEIYPADKEFKPNEEIIENPPTPEVKTELKDYNSDSDVETDNQSSVNTIELNSCDITIHHTEETEEKQNRKTASTGDLTKIQKNRKTSTGTLERAQSLDITDTGMPAISKKRKGAKLEESFDSKASSNDSLYGNVLINKEPRLSLILDGLNTFQRSRLKKSTEWGNLEDAILNLNRSDSSENGDSASRGEFDSSSEKNYEFGSKSPEFDALVNKINEIKQETCKKVEEQEKELKDNFEEFEKAKDSLHESIDYLKKSDGQNKSEHFDYSLENISKPDDEMITILEREKGAIGEGDSSFVSDVLNAVSSFQNSPKDDAGNSKIEKTSDEVDQIVAPNILSASLAMLTSEREFCRSDFYPRKIEEDTNVSDDIKVSRHSLGSLERPKYPEIPSKPVSRENISNISVNDKFVDKKPASSYEVYSRSLNLSKDGDTSELYKTALDETIKNEDDKVNRSFGKVLVSTPDLIKNVTIAEAIHDLNNEVTIEGPTSLTFEIPAKPETLDTQAVSTHIPLNVRTEEVQIKGLSNGNVKNKDAPSESKSSLTYITEIQVLTPNPASRNVSEIEITPSVKNLDSEFENYVKNFEIKSTPEVRSDPVEDTHEFKLQRQKSVPDKLDAEKELSKIQEIAEEQLKKLPEMRFTTSSYEPCKIPEKRQSQIELLRSNFEKSPPKPKPELPPIKSRIPIATNKTPPTSPERRDSRNLDFEVDKDLIEIMASGLHSTPKFQPNKNASTSRNVTVTSIRNSKIPSGLPTLGNRPPVPPRKTESSPETGNVIQVSANGNSESNSFKQWVFNPSENTVTNITVIDNNKTEK
ncbi:hypothetical protein Trydic_g2779 [Trypoxylus dichotomus]